MSTSAKNLNNKIFTDAFKKKADAILNQYETKRASILEILRLIQEEYGYISLEAEATVADYLEIPPIDVREVMTFYTLFYNKPKAKTRLNICRTLACSITGGDAIMRYLEKKLGVKSGEMTRDGKISWQHVECLGACEIAPMMQLNDHEYIGHLTEAKIDEIIEKAQK